MAIPSDKLTADNDKEQKQALIGRPYGGSGIRCITGTGAVTGLNAYWITVLTDAVFTTLTPVPGFAVNANMLTPQSFPAGTQLGLRVSAITLASGSIVINEI